jgi:pimeloyl-ACP methyl ester carboxylesterase
MMKVLGGKYAGRLSEDKKQIAGTWYQGGASLPLNVSKTSDKVITREIRRPQTPRPPFPYKSEDVEYNNADQSVHFGATFTVPLPDSGVNYFRAPVYPTILLITGSGMQDRDETMMNHKPFAVIADYLTRQGFAVLRVDDRGMGKTRGNFSRATSADFAKDVEAGIDYLKTRNDVDSFNIGLLGHSEGGMIAPMVAAHRADVKFIVLLAGPGVKIAELMEDQSIDVAVSSGASKKKMEQFRPMYRELVNTILAETDTAIAIQKGIAVFTKWQNSKTKLVVTVTTGVDDEKSRDAYVRNLVKTFSTPWFNYFMKFNPAGYLTQLHCSVLALNGEKDIQVAAKPNLAAIKNALEKSGSTKYLTQEMPGLNHLFQHCKKCTVEEYGELEETIAPEALEVISQWIKETVR